VDPRATLVRDRDDLLERIERARVHVARLGADDRRPLDPREDVAKLVDPHATTIVGADPADTFALAPHPEHRQRRRRR
jgi:hypothetical protein